MVNSATRASWAACRWILTDDFVVWNRLAVHPEKDSAYHCATLPWCEDTALSLSRVSSALAVRALFRRSSYALSDNSSRQSRAIACPKSCTISTCSSFRCVARGSPKKPLFESNISPSTLVVRCADTLRFMLWVLNGANFFNLRVFIKE